MASKPLPQVPSQPSKNMAKLNLTKNRLESKRDLFEDDEKVTRGNGPATGVSPDKRPLGVPVGPNDAPLQRLASVVRQQDFSAFLSHAPSAHMHSPSRSTFGATVTTSPCGVAQMHVDDAANRPHLFRAKSKAILSAVLMTHNKATPMLTLKRSIEKSDERSIATLTPSVRAMYVYLLSNLILQQSERKMRNSVALLARSFGIKSEADQASLARQAYNLTRYHLAELSYNASLAQPAPKDFVDVATHARFTSERTQYFRTRQKQVAALPQFSTLLIVLVNSASTLQYKDIATKSSDPYVCLHLTTPDDKCHKSKSSHGHRSSVKKTSLNPVWDETFVLKSEKRDENTFICSVFDSDLVTKDDFMGTVHIRLQTDDPRLPLLPLDAAAQVSYYLQPREKKQSFFSKLTHGKDKDKSGAQKDGALEGEELSDQGLGSVRVSLYFARRELEKSDALDSVPADIRTLLTINHQQYMADLVEFIMSTTEFKTSLIFSDELASLLTEFEQRVAISSLTRLTTILNHVIDNFSITQQHLKLISTTLDNLVADCQSGAIMLTNDMATRLTTTIKSLKSTFSNIISRYGLSFPVMMNEAGEVQGISGENGKLLVASFDIIKKLITVRCFQKGIKGSDIESKLNTKIDKYLNNYFDIFFKMVKENSEVSIEDSNDFRNIVSMLDIYDAIEIQIHNDISIYSQFFGKSLIKKSVVSYYKLLRDETLFVLSKELTVSIETFTLLKKIQSLMSSVIYPNASNEIKGIEMNLNEMFSPFIRLWIDQARNQFNTWMERSLDVEKWVAIDVKNKVLHSSSVMDLFQMFEIGKNHLAGIGINVDKAVLDFIEIVAQCYQDYLETVMSSLINELDDVASPLFNLDEDDSNQHSYEKFLSFIKDITITSRTRSSSTAVSIDQETARSSRTISTTICVKLNSIDTSRQLLDDLCNDMIKTFPTVGEDRINDAFAKSFTAAKRNVEYLSDLSISKIGRWVNACLVGIMLTKLPALNKRGSATTIPSAASATPEPSLFEASFVDGALQDLTTYLSNELRILSGNLYHPTFNRFIRGVWQCIWKMCERLLFPGSDGKMKQKQTDDVLLNQVSMILAMYGPLEAFFYADGEGMILDLLRKHAEPLFSTLPVYFTGTSALISLHQKLVATPTYRLAGADVLPAIPTKFQLGFFQRTTPIREVHIMAALFSRQKDNDAKQFAKTNKTMYKNRFIQDRFDLSKSTLVEKYKCRSSLGIPTVIYLMDDCMCISTILSYNETNSVVKYANISRLQKQTISGRETFSVYVGEKSYDLWDFAEKKKAKLYKSTIQLVSKFNDHIKLEEAVVQHAKNQDIEYEFVANLYKLPKGEKIVSNHTAMRKGMYGRITLTTHFLCYQNHVSYATEKIDWSDISDIKKFNSFFSSGIQLTVKSAEKMKFTALQNRDQLLLEMLELKSKSRMPVL
ncbi:hypothetical protein SAMD00019534_054630 [Acytostelium subglobosum LB1]|uniref:hypothetical protein n=1 Tax=Acytostelium subglobosum LB1 TaxID=1410327 RepID=UPI000644A980|nr:hypothetical protein SAMD00019534_054630 [Acytostelium subglobosum LB1]GAM22288.1 hypothetical protein SAMD00019534_054630 [Acytostelium subglobosum LB1]|eukprot:XP_012754408.1 hypothetical protein SAMD00019534_054630 [Acytostelium subglobosum LB1]